MRRALNYLLLVAFVALLGAVYAVPRVSARRNFEFMPEMVRAVPYESYSENALFPDGRTMRELPAGVIVRGSKPLHYRATKEDAARAGLELIAPAQSKSPPALTRGALVYATYCQLCHGLHGKGDGTVAQRGFPAPPSFLAENALKIKDGQIFHIVTYGQNNMPSYAAQVTQEDRWNAVAYVRKLQRDGLAAAAAARVATKVPAAPGSAR